MMQTDHTYYRHMCIGKGRSCADLEQGVVVPEGVQEQAVQRGAPRQQAPQH